MGKRRHGFPSCDLPHRSGVSSQQLVSGQRNAATDCLSRPATTGVGACLDSDPHGSGGTSADQASNSGFEMLSASAGFIVATLDAEGGRWNVPVQDNRADDVAYVGDVIRSCRCGE